MRKSDNSGIKIGATGGASGGASGGAGGSGGSDGPTPAERLSSIETEWSGLQDDLMLKEVFDALGTIDSDLATLPATLEQYRSRGYVFKKFLERKVQVLVEQWGKLRGQVHGRARTESDGLRAEATKVEGVLGQTRTGLQSARKEALLTQANSAVSGMKSKVEAAKNTVLGMFSDLRNNIGQTEAQLAEIGATLDYANQASFPWLASEDVILAIKAQYDRDGKEDPQGILFLTDARVIFERKEEVATKKFLFITTEKEMVQELVFDVVIGDVETLKAASRGMMGNEDWLDFAFTGRAPVRVAKVHIWYESNDWQALFGRVKSGEIEQERTKPKDQGVAEAAKAAPTKCGTCGATINVQVTKGMTQITCEYCGSVIRL